MNHARTYAAILVLTLLAACAGGQLVPQSAQQQVFAAKQAYEVALTVAVAYRNLPACAVPVKMPCHDKAILSQIQIAQPAVRAALDAGESAVRNPALGKSVIDSSVIAAEATLKSFVAITSTLKVK